MEVVGTEGLIFNDSSSNPDLHLWKSRAGKEVQGLADLEEVEGFFPVNPPSTNPDGSRVRDEEGWIAATDGMSATVQAIVDTLDSGAPLLLTTGEDLQQALDQHRDARVGTARWRSSRTAPGGSIFAVLSQEGSLALQERGEWCGVVSGGDAADRGMKVRLDPPRTE